MDPKTAVTRRDIKPIRPESKGCTLCEESGELHTVADPRTPLTPGGRYPCPRCAEVELRKRLMRSSRVTRPEVPSAKSMPVPKESEVPGRYTYVNVEVEET